MRTTRNLTAALLASMALAGCTANSNAGDGGDFWTPAFSPSATATAPSTYAWQSACELLSGVDGAALIDESLSAPLVSKPGRCQIKSATAHSTAGLDLYIASPGGAADFDFQKKLQGVDAEVPGLGDDAFLAGDYLHVLVGDNEFTLVATRSLVNHPALTLDERVAAARTILTATAW